MFVYMNYWISNSFNAFIYIFLFFFSFSYKVIFI